MKRDLKLWKCDDGTYDVLDYYDVDPETGEAAIVATNVPAGVFLHADEIMATLRNARDTVAAALRITAPQWYGTEAEIAEHVTIRKIDAAIKLATGETA
jgi:hypothetical protein